MRSGVESSILASGSLPSLAVVTLYPAFLRLTSSTRTLRESASTRRSCRFATWIWGRAPHQGPKGVQGEEWRPPRGGASWLPPPPPAPSPRRPSPPAPFGGERGAGGRGAGGRGPPIGPYLLRQ